MLTRMEGAGQIGVHRGQQSFLLRKEVPVSHSLPRMSRRERRTPPAPFSWVSHSFLFPFPSHITFTPSPKSRDVLKDNPRELSRPITSVPSLPHTTPTPRETLIVSSNVPRVQSLVALLRTDDCTFEYLVVQHNEARWVVSAPSQHGPFSTPTLRDKVYDQRSNTPYPQVTQICLATMYVSAKIPKCASP